MTTSSNLSTFTKLIIALSSIPISFKAPPFHGAYLFHHNNLSQCGKKGNNWPIKSQRNSSLWHFSIKLICFLYEIKHKWNYFIANELGIRVLDVIYFQLIESLSEFECESIKFNELNEKRLEIIGSQCIIPNNKRVGKLNSSNNSSLNEKSTIYRHQCVDQNSDGVLMKAVFIY